MSPRTASLIGGAGLLGCALAGLFDPAALARGWLAAALTLGLLPIGALAALMTWGLTGGAWGTLGAPAWRALAATLPVFALALLPLLLALDTLFPWTAPAAELPEVVRHKTLYLNEPFFLVRSLVYFAAWGGLALALGVWRRRALTLPPGLCAGGLLALLFTLTFFGFDWMLSLEPKFYTDVFGLWLGVTAAGAATAVVLLATPGEDPGARGDLAALWIAVLLGWAFLAFAQYIIIWSGNMPHEIAWYLRRGEGVWRAASWVIFLAYFALPFALLLPGRARRSAAALRTAASLVLAGYVLQVLWWVLPAFHETSPLLYLDTALGLITLAALAAAAALATAGRTRHG